MKKRFSEGADERREVALKQERKRLDLLGNLKASWSPFANAEEVSSYMADDNDGLNTKA